MAYDVTNELETALAARLASGTALLALLGGTAIYNSLIPVTKTLPGVVFSFSTGPEDNITPRHSQRIVYVVKAVADSLKQAGRIAAEVHALLDDATLSVAGSTNYMTQRINVVRYEETLPTGKTAGHSGGEYEFRLETQ